MVNRTLSRAVANLCIAVLLFSQMAVAAYACQGPANQSVTVHEATAGMVMAGCEEMAGLDDASNLCREHCQSGNQSVGALSSPLPPVTLAVLAIAPAPAIQPGVSAVVPEELLTRHTGPPLAIRFSVFRI